ncbi:hypothetical protein JF541_16195 [Marinobacter hydrocarbonoclasticus]|uniref:hypothetical protein n=1 Tax=Marinobacter nauticus TaxID=2743 RepID=UPI001A8BFF3E|nr:hypothetical protein [Marinobacter nauticus]MBN8240702.1 hypothetical protein [Marinobacter nauticus]
MGDKEELIAGLREAVRNYHDALSGKSGEEREDLLRVVDHAEVIADAMSLGDVERAKLSIYALSRQVTDSYYQQPQEFGALSSSVKRIKKHLFGEV